MTNPRRLLAQAAAVLAMQAIALAIPDRAHATGSSICGGPICVQECAGNDVQCDALTDGVCPHFDSCTYEPSCGPYTGGLAVICL